jgi:hypothetical protein
MPPSAAARPDLATRLRQSQRSLKTRLSRPGVQLALMRTAHETLDPEEIGELIVANAAQWLKTPALAVYAVDMDGQVGLMAARGLSAALSTTAAGVSKWVLSHGREFASADLRRDLRVRGSAGAAFAVRLEGRTAAGGRRW